MATAGRPKGGSDARLRLIDTARQLFANQPYHKVTTRLLAEKAGVNAALIRYYFGNKNGLFEAMMGETTLPIRKQFERVLFQTDRENMTGMLRTYYQAMAPYPEIPRLIFRVLEMPSSAPQRKILDKVMPRNAAEINRLHKAIEDSGALAEGIEPPLAWLSLMSLTIFPFLVKQIAQDKGVLDMDAAFFEKLAEHNVRLLTQGIFKNEKQDD